MKHPPLIYLAAPYTHPDPKVCEERFHEANRAAAWVINEGFHVFSPVSHTHPIKVDSTLKGTWETWMNYDKYMLSLCDELWILRLPGWAGSKGISAEMLYAEEIGKPMRLITPFPYRLIQI